MKSFLKNQDTFTRIYTINMLVLYRYNKEFRRLLDRMKDITSDEELLSFMLLTDSIFNTEKFKNAAVIDAINYAELSLEIPQLQTLSPLDFIELVEKVHELLDCYEEEPITMNQARKIVKEFIKIRKQLPDAPAESIITLIKQKYYLN